VIVTVNFGQNYNLARVKVKITTLLPYTSNTAKYTGDRDKSDWFVPEKISGISRYLIYQKIFLYRILYENYVESGVSRYKEK
jgi:hypothetical protein